MAQFDESNSDFHWFLLMHSCLHM